MSNGQGLSDLFTALEMFKSGATDLGRATAIHDATAEIQKAKVAMRDDTGEIIKEADRFNTIKEIGIKLAAQLAAGGTPATTIDAVVGRFGGNAKNPQDLILQGVMEGGKESEQGKYMIARGQEALRADAAVQMEMLDRRLKANAEIAEASNQTKVDLAKTRGQKPLNSTELKTVVELETQSVTGEDLLAKFNKKRNMVGLQNNIPMAQFFRGLADPDFKDFQAQVGRWFDDYKNRISGTAVGKEEEPILRANTPNMTDTPPQFQKKIQTILEVGKRVERKMLELYGKAGRDVSGFADRMSARNSNAPRYDYGRKMVGGVLYDTRTGPDGKTLFSRAKSQPAEK